MAIIIFIFFFIAPAVLTLYTDSGLALLMMIIIWVIDLVLLCFYMTWWNIVGLVTPKITYRQFIALYNVMPDHFILNDYDIKYYDKKYKYHDITYSGNDIDFKTFIDVMRYRHFHKRIEEHKTQQEQLQNQAELITDLQRELAREQADIDYFMKEHLIK